MTLAPFTSTAQGIKRHDSYLKVGVHFHRVPTDGTATVRKRTGDPN